MPSALRISRAQPEQAAEISQLITGLASYFIPEPAGKDTTAFFDAIGPQAIASCIASPAFRYYTASAGALLHGVIALRGGNHVHHLFVAPQLHRCGTGRALWEHAKRQARLIDAAMTFTVNSSVYAVPVYQRLGFDITGTPEEKNGIRFVPMAYSRAD